MFSFVLYYLLWNHNDVFSIQEKINIKNNNNNL